MYKLLLMTFALISLIAAPQVLALTTVQEILEAKEAIDKIKTLSDQLKDIDALPDTVNVQVTIPNGKRCGCGTGYCNGCCYYDGSGQFTGQSGTIYGGGSGGNSYFITKSFTISRRVLHDDVQAKIDQCMEALKRAGVIAP